ncbi:hypothetical protein D3C72_1216530 [compost metagenome]
MITLAVIMFLIMVTTIPSATYAGNADVVLQTQGFLGERALGLGYQFNPRHRFEASVGTYNVENDEHRQLNLGYTYSPFSINSRLGETKIFSPGVYTLFTRGHDLYFSSSPDHYPYKDYYDPNGVRFGLSMAFSHVVHWTNTALELVYQVMALDQGVIAAYNNSEDIDELEYFMSSGLMLRVGF